MDATVPFHCELGPLSLDIQQPGGGLIAGVGTGALVWTAGYALGLAILRAHVQHSGVLADHAGTSTASRAIELGCGCSALPTVALALTGRWHVVATDMACVLPAVRTNLAAYQEAAAASAVPSLRDTISIHTFSWDDRSALAALACDSGGYTLVLCAELDWMESLHESLTSALIACLAPTTHSLALISSSSTGRERDEVLTRFLARLSACGLVLVELSERLEPIPPQGLEPLGTCMPSAPAAASSSGSDGARFFAARWGSLSNALSARARLSQSLAEHSPPFRRRARWSCSQGARKATLYKKSLMLGSLLLVCGVGGIDVRRREIRRENAIL